jgi:hypothetical protein
MNGFGLMNSNGSVNLGPNSPVWADGSVSTCLGDACKVDTAGIIGIIVFVVVFSIVIFFFVLKEGGWRRTLTALVIPVWIISATVYHFL